MAEKTFTLSEALDYLDNLEVSLDSEEESLDDLQSANIYLQPPLNSNRPSSDVDSSDENTAAADKSKPSGNELLSSAVLEIKCPSEKVIVGQSEDTAAKAPVQKAKRWKKDNSQHLNKWIHSEISLPTGFESSLPDPVLKTVEPPVSLFEKFFTDEIMKLICEESIRYAMQSLREIIVLPLTLTRWKHLSQSFWLMVIWTCQDNQCIGNTMKTPTTQ